MSASERGREGARALPPDFAIVDAHHHLWALDAVDYPWLRAKGELRFFGDPTPIQVDYTPDRFRAEWVGLPIHASVHVQVGTAPGAELDEKGVRAAAQPSGVIGHAGAFTETSS